MLTNQATSVSRITGTVMIQEMMGRRKDRTMQVSKIKRQPRCGGPLVVR
jgi:hypothetical protein